MRQKITYSFLLMAFIFSFASPAFPQDWEYMGAFPDEMTEVAQIQMLNENIGWVSGMKEVNGSDWASGVWKTTDGCQTWIEISPPPTGSVFPSSTWELYFYDEMTGWAGGENGVLYVTTDGGST